MSLQSRQERFAEMASRLPCQRPNPLIAIAPIEADLFDRLRNAAALYISKSIPRQTRTLFDEKALLGRIAASRKEVKNFTPNGMIVAKRHLILEYNLLVQAYIHIINSLGIADFISSWHVPLNLRYKDSEALEDNMKRHHPTEHTHSDSWAGESADSITTIIPIFGDVEHNRVDYFAPPPEFEESWLGALPTYAHGAEIAAKYSRLKVPFLKGFVYLADFSVLHATTRDPGAGARVSIDTTFAMQKAAGDPEVIHPWRVGERASHQELLNVGMTRLFVFPDTEDQQVDSQGGFKHPSNLRIVSILE